MSCDARDWKQKRLGDLVAIRHGWPFKSASFSEQLSGRPIVVNIGNFRYTGGFRFDSTTVKEYRDNYPKEYELKPDDILLVMTCQTAEGEILGIPARVPNDGRIYLHNQRMGKVEIRSPDCVDRDFLYYLFLSPQFNRELFITASGTKILHTSPGRIENYLFKLPPTSVQRTIGSFLRALDDKIELNRQMSQTLEAIARTTFKSWFVDFDPPRAKMEGRWRSGESLPGLAADLYDLFPDSCEDSTIGEIPKGWNIGRVGDEFDITMGQSPPGETYNEDGDGLPFFQGRTDFGFRFPAHRVSCTQPNRTAEAGDTLVSVRAPVGDLNMAEENCCIGRGVSAMRHKQGGRSYTYYAAYFMRDSFLRFEADGTVFGSMSKMDFENIQCLSPAPDTIEAFERFANPIDNMIELNEKESRTIAGIRDTLLPKLISGEVCVRSTERLSDEQPQ
jgi:type I restriction enzyme S subunit